MAETPIAIDFYWTASAGAQASGPSSVLRHEVRPWTLLVSGIFFMSVNVSGGVADFPTLAVDARIMMNWNWNDDPPSGPLSNSWPRESLSILRKRINNHISDSLGQLRNELQSQRETIDCSFPPFVPQVPVNGLYTQPCDPCDTCCNCWAQQTCSGPCENCAAVICNADPMWNSIALLVCIFLIGAFAIGYAMTVFAR